MILLQMLSNLGVVHGTEIAWFTSYISDRVQCVRHNGVYSEWDTLVGEYPRAAHLDHCYF